MRLREYLEVTGRKAGDFAADLSVAENTVRRWLAGTRTPDPAMMRTIHAVTKGAVQPNDLVLR